MDGLLGPPRRLHRRGPAARGLVVDADGVMLGPDCPLIERTRAGYRAIDPAALSRLQRFVFDGSADPEPLHRALLGIARTLDAGDLPRAQLRALQIPVPPLEDGHLARLAIVARRVRKDYDPAESRAADGKWTRGPNEADGPAARQLLPVPSPEAKPPPAAAEAAEEAETEALNEAAAAEAEASALELWAGRALTALRILARASPPIAVAGGILIPLPEASVNDGKVPGRPDLSWHVAEGELSVYQTDADGNRRMIYNGVPGADDIYRRNKTEPVARYLTNAVIIDPDAFPGGQPARAQNDNDPKVCPLPTWQRENGNKGDAWKRYQEQITGMSWQLGSELNGVIFDGCRLSDGVMLEAKGKGYAWMIPYMMESDKFPAYLRIMTEAESQARAAAAANRQIEWHFAEKATADFFRQRFLAYGLLNITVIYTPPET